MAFGIVLCVAGVFLVTVITFHLDRAAPYHLSYGVRVTDGLLIVVPYVVAVCGALLISGYRNVVIFGAVNLVAVIVIAWLTIDGFASIWCAWAAISSAAITLHVRFTKPGPQRAGTGRVISAS